VRDFCEEYLTEIALRIYNLGRKYDEQEHTVELKGEWVTIRVADMPERTKVKVKAALTPDETQKHAQFLLMMYQLQATDPQLALLFGTEQRHAMIDDVYDLMGMGDTTRYMLQPNDDKVLAQLAAQAQAQQAAAQAQAEIQQLQTQLMLKEDQRKDVENQLAVAKSYLEQQEFNLESLDKVSDNMREDEKLELEEWKAEQEVASEREQGRGVAICSRHRNYRTGS